MSENTTNIQAGDKPAKQLRLASKNTGRVLAGVCSGLANYFSIDVGIIRLLLVLSVLLAGFGVGFYLVAWLVLFVTVGYDD